MQRYSYISTFVILIGFIHSALLTPAIAQIVPEFKDGDQLADGAPEWLKEQFAREQRPEIRREFMEKRRQLEERVEAAEVYDASYLRDLYELGRSYQGQGMIQHGRDEGKLRDLMDMIEERYSPYEMRLLQLKSNEAHMKTLRAANPSSRLEAAQEFAEVCFAILRSGDQGMVDSSIDLSSAEAIEHFEQELFQLQETARVTLAGYVTRWETDPVFAAQQSERLKRDVPNEGELWLRVEKQHSITLIQLESTLFQELKNEILEYSVTL